MALLQRPLKRDEVKNILYKMLAGNEVKVGDRMPSENVLSKEYGVARNTVREAIESLVADGLVNRIHGKGTFVADRPSPANKLVALVVPWSSNGSEVEAMPFFNLLIKGISAGFAGHSFNLLLPGGNGGALEGNGAFDGAIVFYPRFDEEECLDNLERRGLPFISIGRPPQSDKRNYVQADNFGGACQVMEHLISLGHSRISYIGNALISCEWEDRLNGYRKALADHGLEHEEHIIIEETSAGEEDGYRLMEKLIHIRSDVTAVFMAGDFMAIGAIRCLRDRGLTIPEDISVIGFDDIGSSAYLRPALTTIHQPVYEVGKLAAEKLVEIILHGSLERIQITLDTELVVRKSCALPCSGYVE
ncbi:MAG: GntR family transcriptional regulator [bacterium]|nr:GntR family transcriptional regulator [bacterium]